MGILIAGFDIDLDEIEEKLGAVSPEVYFKAIPIGQPVYEPPSIQEVPRILDAIVFVYSKHARYSSQLMLYYGKVESGFTAKNYYYYCLESFTDKDTLEEGPIDISFDQLKSMVSAR